MPIDPQDAHKAGLVPVAIVAMDDQGVTISGDAVVDTTSLEAVVATETTLASMLTAIGNAEDAANDPTVIGLLKQIIVKLGDVETAVGA